MIYGILKDVKEGEFRVISTPPEVKSIVAAGFPDEKYAEDILGIADKRLDPAPATVTRSDNFYKNI